jgi:hypothetical protein
MSIYVEPIHLGVAKIPFIIVENGTKQPCYNNWCFKLEHLVDVKTLLNLACIVLILSVTKNLIKLTRAWDVFIIDLVQAIKLIQAKLHMTYS